ncbi:MAG: hypothetical protein EOO77_39935 [Oxalobacteraceae bacterium]|nr:MAG: hypothetical protein EOO77_39935 [Oxalobacteraceae bacterium]
MNHDVQHEPPEICVEEGLVVVDGPGCMAFTTTAETAQKIAAKLNAAAVIAYGQRATGMVPAAGSRR